MDILDSAPSLPDWNQQTQDALLATRTPGMGEFLGGSVREGWWNTTLGTAQAVVGVGQAEHQDGTRIPQDQWRYSPYWREGIAWDEGMTVGRARAQAETFDENRYRRSMMEARDAGFFETVLSFGGMLLGAIPDPVNFVPIAGPASRGLRAAGTAADGATGSRAALAAAAVLERPGVAGSALRGAVDAVGGNAAAAPVVYGVQAQFGDEVTFQRVVTDLALGAVIGTGFGTAAGLLSRTGGVVRPGEMAAVRTLDAAAQDVARTGEVQTAAPAMATRLMEETVLRSAPPEVRAVMPEGATLADLPLRPDGAPLTRAEFDARVARAAARFSTEAEARAFISEFPTRASDADMAVVARYAEARTAREASALFENAETRAALDRVAQASPAPRDFYAYRGGDVDAEARIGRGGLYTPVSLSRRWAETHAGAAGVTNIDRILIREGTPLIPVKAGDGNEFELLIPPGQPVERLGSRTFEDGTYRQANGRLDDVGNEWVRTELAVGGRSDAAFAWYREAVAAKQQIDRLSTLPPTQQPGAQAAAAPRPAGDGETTRAMDSADTDMGDLPQQIEALRAEGRLSPGDDATIKAATETAKDLEGAAKGLEEAAACIARRLA